MLPALVQNRLKRYSELISPTINIATFDDSKHFQHTNIPKHSN